MTVTTSFPGTVNLDPIQGLIDYVQDIKPYHTKIFETLVEYIYTDFINVNITDVNDIEIDLYPQDNTNLTITENNGTVVSVPASIIEAFDFFSIAPSLAPSQTIVAADSTHNIVYFTGNILKYVSLGDILNITGSSGNNGNYSVISAGFNTITSQTGITLNTLVNSTSGGTATFFNVDTTYTFNFAIQKIVTPGPTIIDPSTAGTSGQISFTAPIFVVNVNATRAIQAGSIFKVQGTTSNDGTYYAIYVNFIPGIAANGQREPSLDTTTIGVGIPTGSPSTAPFVLPGNIVNQLTAGGNIIPYNITGYDERLDAPFSGMSGYRNISG